MTCHPPKKKKKRKKAAAEDTEFGEKDLSLDLGKCMRVAVRTQQQCFHALAEGVAGRCYQQRRQHCPVSLMDLPG